MTIWQLIFELQTAIEAGVIKPEAIYTDQTLPQLEELQEKINKANLIMRNPLNDKEAFVKLSYGDMVTVVVFKNKEGELQWHIELETWRFFFPWQAPFKMN